MEGIPWRPGLPNRCGSCLGFDLTYSSDGVARCRTCGHTTYPAWMEKPETTPSDSPPSAAIAGEVPDSSAVHPSALPAVVLPPAEGTILVSFAWGFLAALAGGAILGLAKFYSICAFGVGVLALGFVIGWAVDHGGANLTGSVVSLAAVLTMLSVFLGDIVFLSLLILPYGGTPLDAFLIYPAFVLAYPIETLLTYLLGVAGAGGAMATVAHWIPW